jgi:hypothetical protein
MRIEDDDGDLGSKRSDVIKHIQQYQEQQDRAEVDANGPAAKQVDGMSTQQLVQELVKESEVQSEQQRVQGTDEARRMETRQDVQSGVQAHEVARIEQTHEQVTGAERAAEAVDAASKQQDRGENWHKFATEQDRTVPQSVQEIAAEQQKAEIQREEAEKISVRDFQNDMAVRRGMIKS